MIRIAHLSDLHFGRIDSFVVSGLLDDLAYKHPDYVVITGDLTQTAARSEFEEASEFVRKLPGTPLIVPGNHDLPYLKIWLRFLQPYKRFYDYISTDLNPIIITKEVALAGLNSSRTVGWHWNWSHGRISYWQLDLLQKAFAAVSEEALRVVACHHPVMPPPDKPSQKLVGRAEAFAHTLAEVDADIVLTGHLHRDQHANLLNYYPEIERSILVLQSGTATSTRLRGEVNSYTILNYSAPALLSEKRVWMDGFFKSKEVKEYRKEEAGLMFVH